jgi:hypothetical protein
MLKLGLELEITKRWERSVGILTNNYIVKGKLRYRFLNGYFGLTESQVSQNTEITLEIGDG